jgi:ligand-binding SRPBCC domain-containing protein
VPCIHLETRIAAPAERCFDLTRDVGVHVQSARGTRERAVGGVTSGLLDAGDEVTWEAVHFGIRQRLTVRVTRCERPRLFQDEMVRGAFQSFTHRHTFLDDGDGTLMIDDFCFTAPLGMLGRAVGRLVLEPYLRGFLLRRALHIKRLAERRDGMPA